MEEARQGGRQGLRVQCLMVSGAVSMLGSIASALSAVALLGVALHWRKQGRVVGRGLGFSV